MKLNPSPARRAPRSRIHNPTIQIETSRKTIQATESRRLNRLVSDLLDMTRIEAGIVELHPADVDIAEAIRASVDRLQRQSPDRPVTVEVPSPAFEVIADWNRLAQVLGNLLENADHAAPRRSPIRVTARRENETIVVRISDMGPGVPARLRDQVFERFTRGAEADSHHDAGMGLGLPIVRGLVEAQGGRVWLEDGALTGGACFAFSLPAAETGTTEAGS